MTAKPGRPINPNSKRQKKRAFPFPDFNAADKKRAEECKERGQMDETTKLLVVDSTWQRFRYHGMTLEYFELVEITDPSLMEPSSLLKWKDAIQMPRYADALQKMRDAEARIQEACRAGGEKMRQKSISHVANGSRLERFLYCNFEDVLDDIRTQKSSVNHGVQRIRSRVTKDKIPWPPHESADWPSDSTLYKTLRKLSGS